MLISSESLWRGMGISLTTLLLEHDAKELSIIIRKGSFGDTSKAKITADLGPVSAAENRWSESQVSFIVGLAMARRRYLQLFDHFWFDHVRALNL
jgi:hypothetical protein